MLSRLFRRAPHVADAFPLYTAAVAQARQPVFYTRLGVPDTVDGRFELVAVHVFLILQRLKAEPEAAPLPRPCSTPCSPTWTAICARWGWGI